MGCDTFELFLSLFDKEHLKFQEKGYWKKEKLLELLKRGRRKVIEMVVNFQFLFCVLFMGENEFCIILIGKLQVLCYSPRNFNVGIKLLLDSLDRYFIGI